MGAPIIGADIKGLPVKVVTDNLNTDPASITVEQFPMFLPGQEKSPQSNPKTELVIHN